MARSQQTFSKREKEKKKLRKRQEKQQKKEERRASAGGGTLDEMIAYVDENGNITDTPPDPTKKKKEIDASTIELGIPKKEDDEPTERRGKVEFFNDSKGFGFIRDLDDQERYFVHVSGLMQEVYEGNQVTFELERGLKGMNAVRVKKV
ncbi:MAG: cold shock domain-containing protein [Catalinimonas sp.]